MMQGTCEHQAIKCSCASNLAQKPNPEKQAAASEYATDHAAVGHGGRETRATVGEERKLTFSRRSGARGGRISVPPLRSPPAQPRRRGDGTSGPIRQRRWMERRMWRSAAGGRDRSGRAVVYFDLLVGMGKHLLAAGGDVNDI